MKHILALFVAVLLLVGCSKKLDLHPLDTISDATFWKSSSDFKLAANNLYNSLSLYKILSDVQSDIAYNNNNEISNGTYVVTETSGKWTTGYIYIRRCNKLINTAANSTLANDVEVIKSVAEAKFFRAWNYWRLFRLYGGVPIIKEELDIDSEILYNARASRKETVDFILQDLTDAAANLPLKSTLSLADVGRVTQGSALALKAKIALFEGTWGKNRSSTDANGYLDIAIEASNNVISSNQFSLYNGNGANSYWSLFIEAGDDSPESVLDYRYEMDIRSNKIVFQVHDKPCYLATKKLADMYLCSDGLPITQSELFKGYDTRTSEYENRDPRMTMTLLIPGSFNNLISDVEFVDQSSHKHSSNTFPFFSTSPFFTCP